MGTLPYQTKPYRLVKTGISKQKSFCGLTRHIRLWQPAFSAPDRLKQIFWPFYDSSSAVQPKNDFFFKLQINISVASMVQTDFVKGVISTEEPAQNHHVISMEHFIIFNFIVLVYGPRLYCHFQ